MQPTGSRTIAIIGAGPVGLAAAAHAAERGLQAVVFERGPAGGHAVQQWKHVRMFSPWAYNIDKACERLLSAMGWNAPEPEAYPTGAELVEQDAWAREGAFRNPLQERQGRGAPQCRCRDRCIRDLVHTQPRWGEWIAGGRRARGRRTCGLRHARRSRPRSCPLRRQNRCRAGKRTLGGRHAY